MRVQTSSEFKHLIINHKQPKTDIVIWCVQLDVLIQFCKNWTGHLNLKMKTDHCKFLTFSTRDTTDKKRKQSKDSTGGTLIQRTSVHQMTPVHQKTSDTDSTSQWKCSLWGTQERPADLSTAAQRQLGEAVGQMSCTLSRSRRASKQVGWREEQLFESKETDSPTSMPSMSSMPDSRLTTFCMSLKMESSSTNAYQKITRSSVYICSARRISQLSSVQREKRTGFSNITREDVCVRPWHQPKIWNWYHCCQTAGQHSSAWPSKGSKVSCEHSVRRLPCDQQLEGWAGRHSWKDGRGGQCPAAKHLREGEISCGKAGGAENAAQGLLPHLQSGKKICHFLGLRKSKWEERASNRSNYV